jgi:type I restriction-modification system DNA methylase subunit
LTIVCWLARLRWGALDDSNEVSLRGGFLEWIFGDVLGYATIAIAQDGRWELVAASAGGSADAAIGWFEEGKRHVAVPIELAGADQFLEHAKGRARTPIQRGWDDANATPESRWVLVSNFRETRLYAKRHGQAAYELFRLEDLAVREGMLRFVALLGRDAILGGPSLDQSPLGRMLLGSERAEQDVTARLYSQVRRVRARLLAELRREHTSVPADELVSKAQTILDRLLFVAFAEDRQLLAAGTLARAFSRRPVWGELLAVLRSVDETLCRDIAALSVSDQMCAELGKLCDEDFHDDVSIDVLGHIFEQSITDLEQLRERDAIPPLAELPGPRAKLSKRKVEGIFYTPPFVTNYLVRATLGRAIAEAWTRAGGDQVGDEAQRIAAWQAYQAELRRLRVLDPACGSGAFLLAAFRALAHEFDRVNRALAELRGQARTSPFDLSKTVLNENLFGIDTSGESVEITKLSLWLETAERGKPLTFLDRNIRQGNSVVTDPHVDPWAFDWGAGHDRRWREGFDVVLGNPPYVRHERLGAYKDHWSRSFQVYEGTADLFVYFFERGLRQLEPGGRLGFVVSNKWLRGGYAEKLRELVANQCTIESIVDFGHAPVFRDADAFPCIIVLRNQAPPPDHEVSVTQYPREQLGKELLASYVETHAYPLPQRTLGKPGWSLEPPAARALLEKLRANGLPLAHYTSLEPYRGVVTGCNAAFLIDQQTKDRLCREDPSSSAILKKYLRGQDIARWSPEWDQRWMIFTRRGISIDQYPAVKSHLEAFRAQLEPRPKDHAGTWPGRKPGRYAWYEIQDSIDYYEQFDRPKLIYQEIQFHPRYALDRTGLYTNNKAFFIPTEDLWLLAVLNSPAMWWHNWRYLVHMKDEALSPAGDKMVHVPIPRPSAEQADAVVAHVESIVQLTRTASEANAGVLDVLRMQWNLDKPGQALADFSSLGGDEFVREVTKRREQGSARLTRSALADLRQLYDAEAPHVIDTRARILTLEREIAAAVHAAYGLDEADLALLRATAPPRMPLAWHAVH